MRGWLLVLALTAPGWGQSADVQFHCSPSDARVTVVRGGVVVGPDSAADLVRIEVQGDLTLRFHHAGYQDLTVDVPRQELASAAVFPKDGSVLRLPPQPGSGASWLWGLLALPLLAGGAILAASRRPRRPTRRIGGYRILGELGRGGMATVYRAEDEKGRTVAVKLSDQSLTAGAEDRKRFKREGDICSTLRHPHLVEQLAHGFDEGRGYLVLELLEGETLRQRLARERKIPWRDAVALMAPVLDAMAYAHRAGVVHRDLKPENLFCTPQGLKVVDFGVARGDDYTVATATGVVMGTPCYMAPEQLDAQIDPATDQYALGIILYELLTGGPPFDDPDPMVVVEMQMGRSPKPLRQVDPALPAALEAVVGRMLEKNAKRRYADLGEAHGALLACLDA